MTNDEPEDGRSPDMPERVSLEWALKRLLRSKANFEVLEGFLSELLRTDVTILEVLEGEANREVADSKQTRVDMKVRLGGEEIVIVEVQSYAQTKFLPRVLVGATQVINDHIRMGEEYDRAVKVISVSLLSNQRKTGDDYIYYGRTVFEGAHHGLPMTLSEAQKKAFRAQTPAEVFPRYYFIFLDQFDDVARDTFDEWVYFLKNRTLPPNYSARGLAKAAQVFEVVNLTPEQRVEYRHLMKQRCIERDQLDTAREDGLEEGREEGREQGREDARRDIARRLLATLGDEAVAEATGLSPDEVRKLREE